MHLENFITYMLFIIDYNVKCGWLLQTKKTMRSSIPYVVFGLLYAYLLYLSWTPETIRLMFASKYWLPEVSLYSVNDWIYYETNLLLMVLHFMYDMQLPGIAKMFSGEMTLASAWIHLLVVDLFAARYLSFSSLSSSCSGVLILSQNSGYPFAFSK